MNSPKQAKIEAVLFDLDGTLLDRTRSLELFLDQQYARFAGSLSQIERTQWIQTIINLDNHGHVPKPVVYAEIQKRFYLPLDLGQTLLNDYESNFHGLAIPFAGMRDMLVSLLSRHLTLGLVTNGEIRSQRPKIKALEITDYFGVVLISEEQGVRKPDPEIFQRALKALGSNPEGTVFVGDHPESDIAGAAQLGMKTIWKRNVCWPAPKHADAAIDQLGEIPAIISQWMAS